MQPKTPTNTSSFNMLAVARFIVILNGVMNVLPGLALLFAPAWFYQIADFPPFNQHFMGDVGAFSLAIGVGLLVAARSPFRHRSLVGAAALGSWLHVGNHLYDDFIVQGGLTPHILSNTLPLAILAALLVLVLFIKAPPADQ